MRLCTCFRIGEAFNLGCNAVRSGKTVIIELYARVSSSWREDGIKQHFVFADLFHTHPPFLEGSYELWKDSDLWDYDSGRFLHDGAAKMCRCIGKMKKDGKKWALTILNIWEATWDDIEHVQGIICA
ncbi:uncharacterized protein BDZ99DRAFT_469029 [Mytilinidion resinicola]|uniref:Uncharacterized protein n=1 Tax=Mytilinidion resinicola TaxID=574789 RepID=A0A6A6Y207_9PEZI|nr:uncharacterized protein BDZ99DRAFT_469029 [Mytilinidion resinicola]KAF2802255.1 hypothetical protein BDZ99DRAFT_469029 [Mytilinidion resinicola]